MRIEQIIDDFSVLDDWEDRYRYLIELGRTLEPLQEGERTAATKVRGCASQVWLISNPWNEGSGNPRLIFRGDSDAHIVKGLIAVLIALYSGKTPDEILAADERVIFSRLGLLEHLTPQRSNGLASMTKRIKDDAAAELNPVTS